MTNLIKITEKDGKQLVSARELHQYLITESVKNKIGEKFADWFARMLSYGFEENTDYTQVTENQTNAENRISLNTSELDKLSNQQLAAKGLQRDYALDIDMAKELSMLVRNERGKQARKYFIQCEKELKQIKIDFTDASNVLALAQSYKDEQDRRILAENKVKELQPKADFLEKIVNTDTLVDVGQAAKILSLPYGRNTFFKQLREIGIFFKERNEPKQRFINAGYFEVKEKLVETGYSEFSVVKTLFTQKGLEWIDKVLKTEEVFEDTNIPIIPVNDIKEPDDMSHLFTITDRNKGNDDLEVK